MAVECYSWLWAWLFTTAGDKEEPTGDRSLSKSQQNWDQQSNTMIGNKTELFLDTKGRAGREVLTGRDKVRHSNSEKASQHPLVMFSVNQLPSH